MHKAEKRRGAGQQVQVILAGMRLITCVQPLGRLQVQVEVVSQSNNAQRFCATVIHQERLVLYENGQTFTCHNMSSGPSEKMDRLSLSQDLFENLKSYVCV